MRLLYAIYLPLDLPSNIYPLFFLLMPNICEYKNLLQLIMTFYSSPFAYSQTVFLCIHFMFSSCSPMKNGSSIETAKNRHLITLFGECLYFYMRLSMFFLKQQIFDFISHILWSLHRVRAMKQWSKIFEKNMHVSFLQQRSPCRKMGLINAIFCELQQQTST